MLETLRSSTFHLRIPHRCSIGCRSGDMLGQSIPFTLSFFSKAVVVLEVCLGSLCWNTDLRPSLRLEGILLCFIMSQYMLAFMVPSMNCSSPVPAALMQPQTMIILYMNVLFKISYKTVAPGHRDRYYVCLKLYSTPK